MNKTRLKNLKNRPELKFIKKLWHKFPQAEIYLVGGTVRDILLNRDTKDYDIIIRNVKPRDLEEALRKLGVVNLVGRRFGVFKFVPKARKESIDITLPRTEHSLGTSGGYRDFDVQTNYRMPIEKDLSRRDFTINALAYDLKTDQLVDLFNGVNDLRNKKIRTVGSAQKRFKEDYSRILRAIRFSCQLGFTIEKTTWHSIKRLVHHLNDKKKSQRVVPYETTTKEILKTFYHDPLRALDLLDQSNALEELMPEVLKMKGCLQPRQFHSEGDVWQHSRLCLKNLSSKGFKKEFGGAKPNIELILSLLFHDIGKPYTMELPKNKKNRIRFNSHDVLGAKIAKTICQRLKLYNLPKDTPLHIDCDKLAWLVKCHMLLVSSKINQMRASTIAKYFFSDKYPGDNLLKLGYVDAISSIPFGKKPNPVGYYDMLCRIKELKKMGKKQNTALPKPLISGYDVMENFKLVPGPEVGRLLRSVREEQLSKRIETKRQALDFLKKYRK